MSCGLLRGAIEAIYRRYKRVRRLVRRYSGALQLVGKVNGKAAASFSAAAKDGLVITQLDSAVLLESEK